MSTCLSSSDFLSAAAMAVTYSGGSENAYLWGRCDVCDDCLCGNLLYEHMLIVRVQLMHLSLQLCHVLIAIGSRSFCLLGLRAQAA
jgi:hypothetical protein